MAEDTEKRLQGDIDQAEEILSRTYGGKVELALGQATGLGERAHVHRLAVLRGPAELGSGLIMKRPRNRERYKPAKPDGQTTRFLNEWAGLQFLQALCPTAPLAPRLYGGDRQAGILLLEDFGPGSRLDHAVLGEDPGSAAKTMVALSTTLGRMHACSMGGQGRYNQIRRALGPTVRANPFGPKDLQGIRQSLAALALKPRRGFYKELAALQQLVNKPGPFHAYIHSDPCPDNCHWVGPQLRLLDFEGGRYAHALTDGVYPRIHFPTCWCVGRIPDKIVLRAEEAYRSELSKGCPQAADDRLFGAATVGLCAFWAFAALKVRVPHFLAQKDSVQWGPAQQMIVLRLERTGAAAAEFGCFAAIGETAALLGAGLRKRWPDLGDMPYYPAFRAAD